MAPFVVAAGEPVLIVEAHPGASSSVLGVLSNEETEPGDSPALLSSLIWSCEWLMWPGVKKVFFEGLPKLLSEDSLA